MSTVTIACQLPAGIRLDIYAQQYGRLDLSKQLSSSITLNGYNNPNQMLNTHGMIGTGFTVVDGDAWAAWTSQNSESPLLTSRTIYQVT